MPFGSSKYIYKARPPTYTNAYAYACVHCGNAECERRRERERGGEFRTKYFCVKHLPAVYRQTE